MTTQANVITITVKCDLDLDEIYGRVHVYTSQDKSMDWVLDEFCREKNVRRVSTFALRSATGQDYDLTKTIQQCDLGDGALIYCYNKNPPKPKPPPKTRQKPSRLCGTFCILGVLFLLVALAGLIAVIVIYEVHSKNRQVYTVVVDAGSTSSKIYLYSWPASLFFNTGKVQQDLYVKIKPPVSDFISQPSKAAAPIISTIQAKILDEKMIPSSQVHGSPLYLGATAGMRMLREQNESGVTSLYKQLRIDLKKSALQLIEPVKQVRIISGTEEGVDAWVTVNYLEGTLIKFADNIARKVSEINTIGSLDLGGASTQIAFVPLKYDPFAAANTSAITNMNLYGREYDVYSHSFLCYGKSQAQNRILAMILQDDNFRSTVDNPCSPTGHSETLNAEEFLLIPCTRQKHGVRSYGFTFNIPDRVKADTNFTFLGTGDHKSCQDLTDRLFRTVSCPFPRCSINGMYQPELNGKFKAFAGYFYVANFFNATETKDRSKATLSQFSDSVRQFCGKDWNTIKKQYGSSSFIPRYCFDGIYVETLLRKYGFNESTWDSIEFVSQARIGHDVKVKDSTVGWSLGYAVLQSGRIHTESFISISLPLFIGLVVLFSIILIMALILFGVAIYNSKGRRYNANLGSDTTGYGSI